jgi:hypothetical protein
MSVDQDGIILAGGHWSTGRKTSLNPNFSTIISIQTGLELNPCLSGERPASDSLRYGWPVRRGTFYWGVAVVARVE